ncbi:hypothetical protein MML48_2g00006965 [Holotrichia oblita]|uniref:Uncharacterized protein n=1 Tax=Holotrichia oblita TaxID=644536 RepID=A0ACB9TID5_HOLOL|nr:hypothetical protein MML48_2g00006965 [Holotrichia oblita]
MLKGRTVKKPLSSKLVNRFIENHPSLSYNGVNVKCLVCNIYINHITKSNLQRHVDSARHKDRNTGADTKYDEFLFDLCTMMVVCNLPFTLLRNRSFISSLKKYGNVDLPSCTHLRRYLKSVRVRLENKIKADLKNKKVWLSVDETTDDRRKRSVLHVMVRKMEPNQSSSSILLASRQIQECTAPVILKVMLNTLDKFEISTDQILMLVTDDGATMLSVSRSLKEEGGNFLHITCKIQALHLVAEQIRECYPNVDALISSTNKAVFLKSPKRPQPILTPWRTSWLRSAFHYHKYFEDICIKESRIKFQNTQVKNDLQTIHNNYFGLVQALEILQNSSLSLQESVQVLKDTHAQLCSIEDASILTVRR